MITNVGPVHVELLGSVEAVAAAKAELLGGAARGRHGGGPGRGGRARAATCPALPRLVRFGPGGDVDVGRVARGRTGSPRR